MKIRFGFIVLLVIMLTYFAFGCLNENEEVEVKGQAVEDEVSLEGDLELVDLGEDVGAEDIYTRAMAALAEANAYSYIMEIDSDIELPGVYEQAFNVITEGKATFEPPADEMIVSFTSPEIELDMNMYIVDQIMYIDVPELGWVWIGEGDDDLDMEFLQQNVTDNFEIAEQIGLDRAKIEVLDNHYLIFFDSEDDAFAHVIKELALAQSLGDIDTEDLFESIIFRDVYFGFRIDRSSFLPVALNLNYLVDMEIEGETLTTKQSIAIDYLEFGTFEQITVPEDVTAEAIAYQDLVQQN